ncbi:MULTISPECIES: hypothetical protein [unclassified Sphingobium]|uniref:DUF7946 domain-containing protein n=1 Tax=unclassified Sphingobium TaxID=2611147 RepID=UPI0022258573|nr:MULTISPECIES: hypothetical protein [unclassified Sphingobium]MCW2396710.1 hypothetical protein [Sphingobium sp. B8D3B]MCW2420227.1 hypothetical protein [Sphingobium sp. B8D3C]
MSESAIHIVYDGGDAANHTIDARLLGKSLQGIGRMVSDCLFIFAFERLPNRNEKVPLLLKVHEPKRGSYGMDGLFGEVSTALSYGIPIIAAIGPDILTHYVTAIIDKFRGKDDTVEFAIQKMAEMHKAALGAMSKSQRMAHESVDRSDERRHREIISLHDVLRAAISGSGQAATDYVAPVGRSVSTASFVSGDAKPLIVNADDAEAIRESQKLDWTPLGDLTLRTDGFRFHTNGLSVENPDGGFLMAEVLDPVFENESNPYTAAAGKRGAVEVTGRLGRKAGRVTRIQIVEFLRPIDH